MDQTLICKNNMPSITIIDNSFIEKHMLDAHGSYVKVYLYIVMCLQKGDCQFTISSLADKMDNTENDIIRALQHWEKKGLMSLQWDEDQNYLTGLSLNPLTSTDNSVNEYSTAIEQSSPSEQTPKNKLTDKNKVATEGKSKNITVSTDTVKKLANDSDFHWVCQVVQTFLTRPLLSSESELLMFIYAELKFSTELIVHLYEYCVSIGKTNTKYVQAVAISWAEKDITTPEAAEAYTAQYNNIHNSICKALGLSRTLGSVECKYAEKWQNEYHMDISLILEACNRTLLTIHKPDFKYIDGILHNWFEGNVHTLQDVKEYDNTYTANKEAADKNANNTYQRDKRRNVKNQFQFFSERDVSDEQMDELEKILLHNKK